jgi:hypothetical protein
MTLSAKRITGAIVALLFLVYTADWVWFLHRSNSKLGALGSVTYYLATAVKNGQVDVFFNQPQTEVCVRSLFPHYGRCPCWYASRKSNIRIVH